MAVPSPRSLPFFVLVLLHTATTLAVLVPSPALRLAYHRGPILSGPESIKLLVTFYGDFELSERNILQIFLASLNPSVVQTHHRRSLRAPLNSAITAGSVASWWSLTQHYSDLQGLHVSQRLDMVKTVDDSYSLGRRLSASDMEFLAKRSLDREMPNALAVIFTAADVSVDGFCMHACGGHSFAAPADGSLIRETVDDADPERVHGNGVHGTGQVMVPYVWVGNPKLQCPGYCAWPFARPQYGPDMAPLKAPNGVGVDGMIISLAKLLVSAATNPLGDAYYQGEDSSYKPEIGEICGAKFGAGAYPGYPGELLQDSRSGASYNMEGSNGVQFLVPWIWNAESKACEGQA
ncbi:hypothetical protein KP509_05G066700 [Ceratopteris richardii]|uniref:Uncharacterized protein n=1 Tax=Ceratopteris richardii TaxID=49495 RepID=A0A8T2UMG4_CERRI|nr:hypothetical protein KP509_05G066700 [Ceratopteris richardii]